MSILSRQKPLLGRPLSIQEVIDKLMTVPPEERHRHFFIDHGGFYDCAVTVHLDRVGDIILNARLFEGEPESNLGRLL